MFYLQIISTDIIIHIFFSTIIFSTDSGASWFSGTVAADPGKDLEGIVVLSATNAVAIGKKGGGVSTVLRTTDGGLNWSVQPITGDTGQDLKGLVQPGGSRADYYQATKGRPA